MRAEPADLMIGGQAPFTTFEPVPYSSKVRCTVCGKRGYGTTDLSYPLTLTPWQQVCLEGHPWRCSCLRWFATWQGLKGHATRSTTGSHTPLTKPKPHTAYQGDSRVACPDCGKGYRRKADGRIQIHGPVADRCPGSNKHV